MWANWVETKVSCIDEQIRAEELWSGKERTKRSSKVKVKARSVREEKKGEESKVDLSWLDLLKLTQVRRRCLFQKGRFWGESNWNVSHAGLFCTSWPILQVFLFFDGGDVHQSIFSKSDCRSYTHQSSMTVFTMFRERRLFLGESAASLDISKEPFPSHTSAFAI